MNLIYFLTKDIIHVTEIFMEIMFFITFFKTIVCEHDSKCHIINQLECVRAHVMQDQRGYQLNQSFLSLRIFGLHVSKHFGSFVD